MDAKHYWSLPSIIAGYISQYPANLPSYQSKYLLELLNTQASLGTMPSVVEVLVDLAAGAGHTTHQLCKGITVKNAVLVDFSENILNFAKFLLSQSKVSFSTQIVDLNSQQLKIDTGSVDLCVCINSFYFLNNLQNITSEATRILKTNAYFAFNTLSPVDIDADESTIDLPDMPHFYFYSNEKIKTILHENGLVYVSSISLQKVIRSRYCGIETIFLFKKI